MLDEIELLEKNIFNKKREIFLLLRACFLNESLIVERIKGFGFLL